MNKKCNVTIESYEFSKFVADVAKDNTETGEQQKTDPDSSDMEALLCGLLNSVCF